VINNRTIDRMSVGNVYFAGDAAHIHAPLGNRGMNLGI
jgi:2-polyprenyl-6-methoxyphenol hydroxylase-like FAD-dependent oxidoreductase